MYTYNKPLEMLNKLTIGVIVLIWLLHIREIASLKCYNCQESDCQMEEKLNDTTKCGRRDSCVSVFEGTTILYRGCYEKLPRTLAKKCDVVVGRSECLHCFNDFCNKKGPLKCVECYSKKKITLCYHEFGDTADIPCPILTSFRTHCFGPQKNSANTMERINTTMNCLADRRPQCKQSENCPTCHASPPAGCNDIFDLFISYQLSDGDSNGRVLNANSAQVIFMMLICIYVHYLLIV